MVETSDFTLAVGAGASVYKAPATLNGTVMKLGINNNFITACSNLLDPAGTQAATGVTYGNGLFYNGAAKNNAAFIGAPTVSGASPVFAGIAVRSIANASAFPANGETAQQYNKFNIVKDGYIIYRKGITTAGAAVVFSSAVVLRGAYAYVRNTDGAIAFGAAATAAGFTTIGRITELNPDDSSWVVKLDAANAVYTA